MPTASRLPLAKLYLPLLRLVILPPLLHRLAHVSWVDFERVCDVRARRLYVRAHGGLQHTVAHRLP
eukprot:8368577-Pyramimonas_sp.AAC.1